MSNKQAKATRRATRDAKKAEEARRQRELIEAALSSEGVKDVQGTEVADPVDPTEVPEVQVPVEEAQIEGSVALTQEDLPSQLAATLDQLRTSEQARRQLETQLETSRTVNGSQGVRLAEMSDQLRATREQLADAEAKIKATNADSPRKEIARLNGELKQLTADLAKSRLERPLTSEEDLNYRQEIILRGVTINALRDQVDALTESLEKAETEADELNAELFELDPDQFEEEPEGTLARFWYNLRGMRWVGPIFHNFHQLGRAAWRHKLWTLILVYIGAGVVLCKVDWLAWLFPGHIWFGNFLADLIVDADNNLLLMALGGGFIATYLWGHLNGKFRGGFFSLDDKFIAGVDYVEGQIARFFRWVWGLIQAYNAKQEVAKKALRAAKAAEAKKAEDLATRERVTRRFVEKDGLTLEEAEAKVASILGDVDEVQVTPAPAASNGRTRGTLTRTPQPAPAVVVTKTEEPAPKA